MRLYLRLSQAGCQRILPKHCRKTILRLTHTVPLSDHLGQKKTAARIMQRFYWPTLFRDVADFCRSCTQCQKASHRKVPRAPMIPPPVIDEPFQRIAMDVIGPLPQSRTGHRYVLTMRPDPKEILTDHGTNFTSRLLAKLYHFLHVNTLRTSPYHPQTDGMVERFNGTLKEMLRKSAQQDGKNWDKLLPYLLFAYREAPLESTGVTSVFSVFGL